MWGFGVFGGMEWGGRDVDGDQMCNGGGNLDKEGDVRGSIFRNRRCLGVLAGKKNPPKFGDVDINCFF